MSKTVGVALASVFLLLLSPLPARGDPREGLLAHLSFQECRPANTAKENGEVKVYGNPRCIDGVEGKGFRLEGPGDFLELPPDAAYHADRFSLCAWVAPGENKGENILITRGRRQSYYLTLEDSRPAVGLYDGRSPVTLIADARLPKNEWSFLCGTYDESELKIYIDGKPEKSLSHRLARKQRKTALSLWIGHRRRSVRDKHYSGMLDEIRIYDRALTPEEVTALYRRKEARRRPVPDEPVFLEAPRKPPPKEEACLQATFSSETDMLYIPDLDMDGERYKVFMLRDRDEETFTIIKKVPLEGPDAGDEGQGP